MKPSGREAILNSLSKNGLTGATVHPEVSDGEDVPFVEIMVDGNIRPSDVNNGLAVDLMISPHETYYLDYTTPEVWKGNLLHDRPVLRYLGAIGSNEQIVFCYADLNSRRINNP